jgi:uncharacterized protein
MSEGGSEVEVRVTGLFEHEIPGEGEDHHVPVIVLRDDLGRELRLIVSSCEALAVQIALGQHIFARPLTHDLGLRIIERLHSRLTRVTIDAVSAYESHALLSIHAEGEEVPVDARPGDAIALALRAEAPIYVNEELLAIESG